MARSRKALSEQMRQAYGKVRQLEEVPIALYEILEIATRGKSEESKTIATLAESIIETVISDPEGVVKLRSLFRSLLDSNSEQQTATDSNEGEAEPLPLQQAATVSNGFAQTSNL